MGFEDESLYAVIGIPVIFVLGFVGSLIPPMVALVFPSYNVTQRYYFSFFNGMAAGIILSVGLIHSLADAVDGFSQVLTDDSKTDSYPWANFIAMMAILLLFTTEEVLTVIANRFGIGSFDPHDHGGGGGGDEEAGEVRHKARSRSRSHGHSHDEHACDHTVAEHLQNDGQCDAQPLEEACDHHKPVGTGGSTTNSDEDMALDDVVDSGTKNGHSDDPAASDDDSDDGEGDIMEPAYETSKLALFLKMMLLFIGLAFHNVFVGLALGIADNDYVLFIAVIFHQFFEGLGMGSRVAMAKMRHFITVFLIDLVFASIPVVFIGIGIGIKNGVQNADSTDGYLITQGTLQALSAGILVYIALIHMMRAYRDNGVRKVKQRDLHCLFSYLGLLCGAAILSVIGIWA